MDYVVVTTALSAPNHMKFERSNIIVAATFGWLLAAGAVACMAYGVTVVLGGMVLVAVPQAHGQVVDSGILGGADEKTRELLHFLHDIGHGEGFGLGEMLRYFNAAVLVFVAAVLIYHVFYAVVETGRSGEAALTGWQVMRLVILRGVDLSPAGDRAGAWPASVSEADGRERKCGGGSMGTVCEPDCGRWSWWSGPGAAAVSRRGGEDDHHPYVHACSQPGGGRRLTMVRTSR